MANGGVPHGRLCSKEDLVEQRKNAPLMEIVERDFDAFSGIALEQYFKAKFLEEGRYTKIGGWWDRKGENEIDLVCENEFSGRLDFYEIKTNASRYDRRELERKVEAFFSKHPDKEAGGHAIAGVSIEDM